ncbi:MAG TPA: sugar kinase [Anaerolineales bacterium]|nr:sugar kinase [Anaerolineales bacterium]
MTGMEKPIVCLGILVADIVGRPLRSVPDPGRLVLVDEMQLLTGGCAVNSASALALLGIPVEAIGKVGEDPLGDFVIHAMQARGIGTRGVQRDRQNGTSGTMVLVDPDGERRFVHYIGANACLTLADVDLEQISSASILHVAGSLVLPGIDGEPTARLLREARKAGVITSLDTVWDATGRWMQLLAPCLPHLDYFLPSLPEAQAITGRQDPAGAAQALLDGGVRTVAIKMGAEGCLVATQQGELYRLPAFQVDVVDATGAGDAFAAGFIAGVWHGWPLEKTARFASAVGALCVTGLGASGGVRSLPETLEFMQGAGQRVV